MNIGTKEAEDESMGEDACRERKIQTYMKGEGGRIAAKPRTTITQAQVCP